MNTFLSAKNMLVYHTIDHTAGVPIPSGSSGNGSGVGTINVPIPYTNLGGLVSNLVLVALVAAAIFFLVQLLIGGISWINAGGDPKNLESARNRLTNAIIGIVIVAAAFALTLIITSILGINIFSGTVSIN